MIDPGRPPASGMGRDDLATPAQTRAIYLIAREVGATEYQIQIYVWKRYRRVMTDLSKIEAGTIITALQKPDTRADILAIQPEPDRVEEPVQEDEGEGHASVAEYLESVGFRVVFDSSEIGPGPRHVVWFREDGAILTLNLPEAQS